MRCETETVKKKWSWDVKVPKRKSETRFTESNARKHKQHGRNKEIRVCKHERWKKFWQKEKRSVTKTIQDTEGQIHKGWLTYPWLDLWLTGWTKCWEQNKNVSRSTTTTGVQVDCKTKHLRPKEMKTKKRYDKFKKLSSTWIADKKSKPTNSADDEETVPDNAKKLNVYSYLCRYRWKRVKLWRNFVIKTHLPCCNPLEETYTSDEKSEESGKEGRPKMTQDETVALMNRRTDWLAK